MAINIAPGVYSQIIDLGAFVQEVPGTVGLIMGLTEKGPDNVLQLVAGRSEYIDKYGEPNMAKFTKNYGQGAYNSYNYLGESGSLYFMRCLPDDAQYSNLFLNYNSTLKTITTSYIDANDFSDISTQLGVSTADTFPIVAFYPVGRGEYYNNYAIEVDSASNPQANDMFILNVTERQSNGDVVIVESFEVSLNPAQKDSSGESMFIEYVLSQYSAGLRASMMVNDTTYSDGYEKVVRVFDRDVGNVMVYGDSTASIFDNKQNFAQWDDGNRTYLVVATDSKGAKVYGWIDSVTGAESDKAWVYNMGTGGSPGWVAATSRAFDYTDTQASYEIKQAYAEVAEELTGSTEPTPSYPLRRGSDGEILDAFGAISDAESTNALAKGYEGLLVNPITGEVEDTHLDIDNFYFNLVFDAGYPDDVKTKIVQLATTRRDVLAIMDNGDNSSSNAAVSARDDVHSWNTYHAALYESYTKIYDTFTGQDLWVAPSYHMSYLLPRNDNVGEIWTAAAGFTRASIIGIKEMRFNPKLANRVDFYRNQINPIVKFNEGHAPYSQLTTQAKASPLQDINIVRLVLYIERALKEFARGFIFELNDEIVWGQVQTEVVAFLENIKRNRGLYDYSVEVSATDYEKKRKKFHVDCTLNPTRVVEQINLQFFIE